MLERRKDLETVIKKREELSLVRLWVKGA